MARLIQQFTYREAATEIARWLGIGAGDAQAVAVDLIANGILPRCSGRSYVAPDFAGLKRLCAAIVARAGGFSKPMCRTFSLLSSLDDVQPGQATILSVPVGAGEVSIRLPADLGPAMLALEAKSRRR